jgi:hypothetical protein
MRDASVWQGAAKQSFADVRSQAELGNESKAIKRQ